MRVIRTFLLGLLVLSTPVHAGLETGKPAPDFTATDSNGKAVKLSDFKGKTVVLEWTNDQCPFVKKHYKSGNMQGLQKAAADSGVVWLSVISSAPGKQGHVNGGGANALSKERNAVPAHVLLDESGTVGRLYDAKTTPHMYVINAKGALVYQGGIDSNPSADPADIPDATPYVKLALADVQAGKPVANATTRPYGCSIKY